MINTKKQSPFSPFSENSFTSDIWYRGPSFHQFISGMGLQRGACTMITIAPANMPSQPSQNKTSKAKRVRTHLQICKYILDRPLRKRSLFKCAISILLLNKKLESILLVYFLITSKKWALCTSINEVYYFLVRQTDRQIHTRLSRRLSSTLLWRGP